MFIQKHKDFDNQNNIDDSHTKPRISVIKHLKNRIQTAFVSWSAGLPDFTATNPITYWMIQLKNVTDIEIPLQVST
jgi:hypothetical protein